MSEALSERARSEAIRAVELACDEGEIIAADRDLRIQQIKAARSAAEVDLALGALRRRVEKPQPEPLPAPPVGMLGGGRTRSFPVVPLIGGLVAAVAGIAVVVFLVAPLGGVNVAEPPGSVVTRVAPEPQQAADVLSAEGVRTLLEAIRNQTGTTNVFDATLYPTYGVVQLPVDRETPRQQYFYWDGRTLKPNDSFGRSTSPRVDLASIDVEAMLRLVRQIRRTIEEPTSWYVIVNAPDEFDKAVMYAYASNKYSEGGYISATADGEVVRKVTW